MSKIFFIGCTHFRHANIIKLADRPFASVEEMDATLIKNWNDTVSPGDTVFHLGDFAWTKGTNYRRLLEYEALAGLLNGDIIPVSGNHDPNPFGEAYREIVVNDQKIILFHYPIEEWNGWFRNTLHFHCHTHSHQRVTGKNRFNVTVEANDYRPVSLEDLTR